MARLLPIAVTAAALAGTVAFAPAQGTVGSAAPEFDFQGAYNGAPASFAELSGRLVLIEFFATW